ncbi:MAG: apolipoprotein N-acyltransferase [Gammaproteobacteria bacterium]
MLPFAFAPFAWFPLAVLAPALLFSVWASASAGRALWRGWLFGIGMFGVGTSWIQISLHQFGVPVLAFSVSATALFIGFLALFPALLGYLAIRCSPRSVGLRLLLVWPALWTLTEWLRGWLFTGFPWLNLGYSQIDAPLAGLAPVLGVYGVSWATAFSAGVICYLVKHRSRHWPGYLALALALWGGSALIGRIAWTHATGAPLRIALIQGNVEQSDKWQPAERYATLERYVSLSSPYLGADVIIWPETAIPMFYHEARPFLEQLQRLAKRFETQFVVGVPYSDGTRDYNSVIGVGSETGVYHKRHLVPFGEFIPFASILNPFLERVGLRAASFSSGEPIQPAFIAGGQAIGVSICYEDAFGEEVIDALPGAGLLVNVSNDAWFGDSIAPHQHLQIARMRALETGRFLLRATNTGISAIIGPQGKILKRAPQFEPHALAMKVYAHQGASPYTRIGNWGIVTPLIVIAVGGFIRRRGEIPRRHN